MLDQKILDFWTEEIGHLSEGQGQFIIEKLKKFKTDYVLEIGFAGGRHTYAILESFKPEQMVTVDVDFDYQNGRHKIEEIKKEFDTCTFIEDNSASCLNPEFFNKYFPNGVDYVLVDGGHQYNDAMRDMMNCFSFVNEGGIMIVDDYESKVCPLKSVDMAVRDFSEQSGNTFEAISLEDGKGMAVFVK